MTPFLLKTASNPNGAPIDVFDGMRAAVKDDRSQWNKDATMPYYSYNRPGTKVSEGVRDEYWRQGQATGLLAAYHSIGAFSETDFRDDLKKITVPTLVIHGSDDQIVPIQISGEITAKTVKNAKAHRLRRRLTWTSGDAEGQTQRGPAGLPRGLRLGQAGPHLTAVLPRK